MKIRRIILILSTLLLVLMGTAALSLAVGTRGFSVAELWTAISGDGEGDVGILRTIIFDIRLPRVLLAILVGAGLSIAGATFQALLRNPLAEPYILGISSGGTVGAILAMVLGLGFAQLMMPLLSFTGSGLVMMLVLWLGHRRGYMDPTTLLLSGVMVGAFFNAMVLLVVAIFNQELRTAFVWLLGNLSSAEMSTLYVVGPVIVVASLGLLLHAKPFNLLSAGDETAMSLGVEVSAVRKRSYLLASLITGAAVSVSGVIGFVGLLVPHSCRLMFGSDHRILLPASVLMGGTFLVVCDLLARTILSPSEIPVGAITAVVGAPLFVYLLKRESSKM